jgi:hypothetical protein
MNLRHDPLGSCFSKVFPHPQTLQTKAALSLHPQNNCYSKRLASLQGSSLIIVSAVRHQTRCASGLTRSAEGGVEKYSVLLLLDAKGDLRPVPNNHMVVKATIPPTFVAVPCVTPVCSSLQTHQALGVIHPQVAQILHKVTTRHSQVYVFCCHYLNLSSPQANMRILQAAPLKLSMGLISKSS